MQFPGSATLNQIYNAPNGLSYKWDGEKWTGASTGSSTGMTGPTGPTGPQGAIGPTGPSGVVPSNVITLPTSPDSIGFYQIFAHATDTALNIGQVYTGSSLRSAGVFLVPNVNGSSLYYTVSLTIPAGAGRPDASNRFPAAGYKIIYDDISPPGSWLVGGAFDGSSVLYNSSTGTSTWINFRVIHIAVRVA